MPFSDLLLLPFMGSFLAAIPLPIVKCVSAHVKSDKRNKDLRTLMLLTVLCFILGSAGAAAGLLSRPVCTALRTWRCHDMPGWVYKALTVYCAFSVALIIASIAIGCKKEQSSAGSEYDVEAASTRGTFRPLPSSIGRTFAQLVLPGTQKGSAHSQSKMSRPTGTTGERMPLSGGSQQASLTSFPTRYGAIGAPHERPDLQVREESEGGRSDRGSP